MTNEAPLPDDVERCLSEMPNVGGFGEEWSGTIRAHIAAQSEKISALEKKLSEQIREDEMRLINHCVKIVGNNSKAHIHAEAEFLTRIAALEADNKRLREAINEYVMCCPADRDTTSSFLKASDKLESALAQTGEK